MKKDGNNWKSLGIAMGLPSTLFGVIYFVNIIVEKKYISETAGYVFLGLVVVYMFYLMIRFANVSSLT